MSPSRYEVVGAPTAEPMPQRVARARRMLEDVVEPRWRRDYVVTVRVQQTAHQCAVLRCQRPATSKEMCNGHRLRWHRDGRPTVAEYLATTDHVLRGHHVLPSCAVPLCRAGRSGTTLCQRHNTGWLAAGRPEKAAWASTVAVVNDPSARTCQLPHCDLLTDDGAQYCHPHATRWISHGKPGHDAFEAEVLNYGDPRWDFRRLPAQPQLEVSTPSSAT